MIPLVSCQYAIIVVYPTTTGDGEGESVSLALGIDTGGTYTDAVVLDHVTGRVLCSSKALTTYHDLAIGVGNAIDSVLGEQAVSSAQVELVALSTTLATNAIVEERGSPISLLLIGYDPVLMQQYGLERELVTSDIVYLRGGHNEAGNEVALLDEAVAREAIMTRRNSVEAFAISGYFSVSNPAHELRVRTLVEELTGLPSTCGHELTHRLNAVRRATTTALNARLIPLLRELITTVRSTLDDRGISAPLLLVKGDGSLVRAEWAMRRPIETILSGPAASVIGAWHLAGRRDVWVVDMGGTTTDIAVLHDGRPQLRTEGAQVGKWRTMVEAVDVQTAGLGGDSHVRLNERGQLTIGPRRVIPLCRLASEYPQVVKQLRQQYSASRHDHLAGQFVLAQCRNSAPAPESAQILLRDLSGEPQALIFLVNARRYGSLALSQIESLEAARLVIRAGFTPTDALHVLGRFQRWETEASRLVADLLAAQMDVPAETVCERIISEVANRVTTTLVSKVLRDENVMLGREQDLSIEPLMARALGTVCHSDLVCQLHLREPVVGIGAPVEAYLPSSAQQLHTELVVPPYAEVASAVGAVVGSVVQKIQVTIRPLDIGQRFRLLLPDGPRDLNTIEEGVAYAMQVVPTQLKMLARQVGSDQVEVQMNRVDHKVPVKEGWGQEIYLSTELTFTAVGRPSHAKA